MRASIIGSVKVLGGILAGLAVLLMVLYAWLSRTNATLESAGETRHYLLYVPESHDRSAPTALVISLHGAFLYPSMQARLTGWNRLAEREGFIVAYPRATGFPRVWRASATDEGLTAETQFFSDLIDTLVADFNVDPARVYVNGFSNGAAMTFTLSCVLPGRIAAFAMVATAIGPWNGCEAAPPVPMVAFHGTADPFAPYAGGENFLTTDPLPHVEDWFAVWGRRNGCVGDIPGTEAGDGVTLRQFTDCRGAEARLYAVHDAGHIWPGGLRFAGELAGPYKDGIDATETMWRFFEAQ